MLLSLSLNEFIELDAVTGVADAACLDKWPLDRGTTAFQTKNGESSMRAVKWRRKVIRSTEPSVDDELKMML